MRHSGTSGVWSGEEAVLRIHELLSAARVRPQRVDWDGSRYVLSLEKKVSVSAADALARGAPIEEGDEIG